MKREAKARSLIIVSGLIGILLLTIVSAGWLDWIQKTVTGKDTYRPTNVSVRVVGADMVSIVVHNETMTGTPVTPTEEGSFDVLFNVTITDINGASDINTSSVKAEFLRPNEATRSNTTGCVENSNQGTTYSKNFTCTITIWYFDALGGWTINVSASDLGNTSTNSTDRYNFSMGQLQALKIDPEEVFWNSVVAGSTNQTAGNSTKINNTGNYNLTDKIRINATNLYNGTNFLDVGNVSVGIDTGSECNGTFMVDGENTNIDNLDLEKGNLSLGVANETVYYCLATVPAGLPTGVYDTITEGSWTISLF
ncbi:hypothetical protein A3K73_02955 [Candidatus Pacearchaeota archaeon RBG_13_36_9]|nr:MAG: hypothetical protein A3K73_02955 [Candidatus Pacearchaeota archaeon RBG_13_36_9]